MIIVIQFRKYNSRSTYSINMKYFKAPEIKIRLVYVINKYIIMEELNIS